MEEEAYPQKPVDDIVAASVKDTQESQNSFLMIWILVSILLFIAAGFAGYYLATPKSTTPETPTTFPTLPPKPTATPTPNPTADWQTYKSSISSGNIFAGNDYMFKIPQNWTQIESSSNFEQMVTFESKDNIKFTVNIVKNLDETTNKPYETIDEFINMPYTVKVLQVAGQDARQALPRAGSENIYETDFFTKDSKFIFNLSLEFPINSQEAVTSQRQQLFEQILSTFQFTE